MGELQEAIEDVAEKKDSIKSGIGNDTYGFMGMTIG